MLLLFGIILICIAFTWPAQNGKTLFLLFVLLGFIVTPSSQLLFLTFAFAVEGTRGFRRSIDWLLFADYGLLIGLTFASLSLLVAYAIVQRKGDRKIDANSTYLPADRNKGERWDTELTPQELVQVLRRREWAFLIDALPSILFVIAALGLMAYAAQRGRRSDGAEILLFVASWTIVLVEPLLLLYVIFRDSIGGASIGKRITGCKVVMDSNGQRADFVSCLIRNLVFVFPIMALVELAIASGRNDRKRIGDLMARTTVVAGPPKWVDGIEHELSSPKTTVSAKPTTEKHPLDD